jgi:Tfp pilus assembly protein PilF
MLTRAEVASATTSFEKLITLWESRPGGDMLRVEGAFVDFGTLSFPHRSAEAMLRRALNRLQGGHTRDALEAAVFALTIQPENLDALMMAGVCEMRLGNFANAVSHFSAVLTLQPDFQPAAHNLEQARVALAAHGESA